MVAVKTTEFTVLSSMLGLYVTQAERILGQSETAVAVAVATLAMYSLHQ
jgi:hypothetical protein